ncbi:MAG: hypothetical protein JNL05_10620 [Flavobacteriales bacterium]|nr:hypothetical protein [Flavobacteriales bacterium]
MDNLLIQPGVRALAWRHWRWMQDAPRKAIQGLISDKTSLASSFYISGCQVTTTPVGTSTQYNIADGWVCFEGEVMPVVAHSILKGVLQQVYLVVEDIGVDLVPMPDLNGTTFEVMRHRRAKLQVSNGLPSVYMAIDAPTITMLTQQQLAGRLVPAGSIMPYYGDMVNFNTSGLGTGPMTGWAVCNGQNGTPDMRGMVPVGATNVPDAGAGALYAGVANLTNPGDKGGADQVVLDEDQLPAHTHELAMPSASYLGASGGGIGTAGGTGNSTETFPADTGSTGAGNPVDVRQPSFALVYIMSLA